jgi:hypothetical protein
LIIAALKLFVACIDIKFTGYLMGMIKLSREP